jgi:hypothetical protein
VGKQKGVVLRMPYISKIKRQKLDIDLAPESSGELNYVISDLIGRYLCQKGLNCDSINEVIGVLECCKMEIYRRIASPYEDKKRKLNGDVFSKGLI